MAKSIRDWQDGQLVTAWLACLAISVLAIAGAVLADARAAAIDDRRSLAIRDSLARLPASARRIQHNLTLIREQGFSAAQIRNYLLSEDLQDTHDFARCLTALFSCGDRAVLILVVALLPPPLVVAYRSLNNRRRWLVFSLALILPLLPAFVLQPLELRIFSRWIDAPETFRQPTILGIPVAVLGFNTLAAALLWRWGGPMLLRRGAECRSAA